MFDNRLVRGVAVVAAAVGLSVVGAGLVPAVAGATGSTPAPFTVKVNGANSTSVTTSPTSTVLAGGLPSGATGTVEFDQAGSPLCTVTLPTTSCTTPALAPGSYPDITGTYSGDTTYAGSTSTNSVTLTVLANTGPGVTCSKVSGHVTTKVAFTYCRVSQMGGYIAASNLLTGGTLTWKSSKTTTIYSGSGTSPGQGVCKAGHTELDFSGTVTGGTSTYTAIGDPVSYTLCQAATGVVKLVPGTKANF